MFEEKTFVLSDYGIERVLSNLDNAVKFTRKGSIE